MEWFYIYLFVQLDSIMNFVVGISIVVLVAALTGLIIYAADYTEYTARYRYRGEEPEISDISKWSGISSCKKALYASLIVLFICSCVPDQKGLAIIVGSTVAYKAVTSEEAKAIGNKFVENTGTLSSKALLLLEKQLDEALTEQAPAK